MSTVRLTRALALSVATAASAMCLAACGGGTNDGGLSKAYPGQAVFNRFHSTSRAHAEIVKCGFSDSEDQRRQFIEAPAGPTGRTLVEHRNASGRLLGTLEVIQVQPSTYSARCLPAGTFATCRTLTFSTPRGQGHVSIRASGLSCTDAERTVARAIGTNTAIGGGFQCSRQQSGSTTSATCKRGSEVIEYAEVRP